MLKQQGQFDQGDGSRTEGKHQGLVKEESRAFVVKWDSGIKSEEALTHGHPGSFSLRGHHGSRDPQRASTHCRKVLCCRTAEESFFLGSLIGRETVARGDRGEGWIRMECSLCHFKAPRHKYLEHLKFQQWNTTHATVAITSQYQQILANICNGNAHLLIARENIQWCSHVEDSKTISYKMKNPSPWDPVILHYLVFIQSIPILCLH